MFFFNRKTPIVTRSIAILISLTTPPQAGNSAPHKGYHHRRGTVPHTRVTTTGGEQCPTQGLPLPHRPGTVPHTRVTTPPQAGNSAPHKGYHSPTGREQCPTQGLPLLPRPGTVPHTRVRYATSCIQINLFNVDNVYIMLALKIPFTDLKQICNSMSLRQCYIIMVNSLMNNLS